MDQTKIRVNYEEETVEWMQHDYKSKSNIF